MGNQKFADNYEKRWLRYEKKKFNKDLEEKRKSN